MDHLQVERPQSSTSLNLTSDTTFLAPDSGDRKSRRSKSTPYGQQEYADRLESKGSFLKNSQAGILAAEKEVCKTLVNQDQKLPSDSLFDDRYFRKTCEAVESENEMRVIRDITQLITPSADILTIRGIQELQHLAESTNGLWKDSIPFEGSQPQPDYSVGFRRTTFSEDQLKKLKVSSSERSYFAARGRILFPFLTCEVKCGTRGLLVADHQNAHSMTIAVQGVVKLYQGICRQDELHRKVLAFSVSHDVHSVRIYAHYPEIDGLKTRYFRHLLKEFSIMNENGKERWAAYRFTRNVYDLFVPIHLNRIRSAVDQLPDPSLVSAQSTATHMPFSQEAGKSTMQTSQKADGEAELRTFVQKLQENLQQQREEAKQREEGLREEIKQQREEAKQREEQLFDMLKQRLT